MNTVIVQFLGKLLDAFKAKHAGIYTTIFIVLGAAAGAATTIQSINSKLPDWAVVAIDIVAGLYAYLGGAHTPQPSALEKTVNPSNN